MNLSTLMSRGALPWTPTNLTNGSRQGIRAVAHKPDTVRSVGAAASCLKRSHECTELTAAYHSGGKHNLDRPAAPALLPPGLADAVVAQLASRCPMSTEHLRSEHTRGSGAGGHRGAVRACLEERRSCARSWRQSSSQVLHPPAVSIPQQHDTFSATAGRRSGRLSSGKKFNTAREQGSMASAVSASDARMRRSDAIPRFALRK